LDQVYLFCNSNQIVIAEKARIIEFLKKNKDITHDLEMFTEETFNLLLNHYKGEFTLKDLTILMSHIFEVNPRDDLKNKLSKHIIKEQVDVKPSDCFDALGPIIVGMLSNNNKFNLIKKGNI
jgi:hypothetical protein